MNILRALFQPFERRGREEMVEVDKRQSKLSQLQTVNGRTRAALDDLTRTVSMSREQFCELLRKEDDCVLLKEVVQFEPFAQICEHRSAPNGSLMKICKHPEHEANKARIANCNAMLCPKLKEAMRAK